MDFSYKLILSYRGSQYAGFQIQKGHPTIQGELERSISQMAQSKNIHTLGSGRTDAGVHAIGQVVKVAIPLQLTSKQFKKGLNSLLPPDIYVKQVESVPGCFHPIRDSVWKEYWYFFSPLRKKHPFASPFVGLFPFPLDIEKMTFACEAFVGEHDFKNFHCVGSQVKTTVRKIMKAAIIKVDPGQMMDVVFPKETYCFQVRANGFLKQMVRLMMGALLEVGKDKCLKYDIICSLAKQRQGKLGITAPPEGLYLKEVQYQKF